MSLRGYSLILVKANQDADSRHIGVRLGKWCIRMNIPVSEVAQQFGVSRMTVYSWFTGTSRPRKDKVDQIEKLLKA